VRAARTAVARVGVPLARPVATLQPAVPPDSTSST
jgi:hypothetical protein